MAEEKTIKVTASPPYTVTNGTETKEVWGLIGLHLKKGDVLLETHTDNDIGYYG